MQQQRQLSKDLQDILNVGADASMSEIQESYQTEKRALEELVADTEAGSAKEFFSKRLLTLNQQYQEFTQPSQPVQTSLNANTHASESPAVQSSPKSPSMDSYRPISKEASKEASKDSDKSKPKTDALGPTLSEGYVNKNLKEDPASIQQAREKNPTQAKKFDLIKKMEPPVDVRFGMLNGQPSLLVNSKDTSRVNEALGKQGYQQISNAGKAPTPAPQWARKTKDLEEAQQSSPSPTFKR